MSNRPYDLLIISDCVLDIYYRVRGLPIKADDVVLASSMAVSPGGSCNVAVVARRLGLRVAVVDKVGDDVFGELLISKLKDVGVGTELIKRVAGATTVSINIVDDEGNHAFLGYPGVGLTVDDVDASVLGMARAIYIGGFNASISEKAADELLRIVERARGRARVFLDAGPATGNKDAIMRMIGMVDTVFMNRQEAERLLNKPLSDVIYRMRELGVGAVIKLGSEGALLLYHDEVRMCKAYVPDRVVTTVGAGEAFNAAYIAGLLRGLDPPTACDLGNRVASMRLSHLTPTELPALVDIIDNYRSNT